MDAADAVDCGVDPRGDEINRLGVLSSNGVIAGSVVVAVTVSDRPSARVESAHAFSDLCRWLPLRCRRFRRVVGVDAEVGTDEIPVRLFSLQMKFDEIHEDLLQVLGEAERRIELPAPHRRTGGVKQPSHHSFSVSSRVPMRRENRCNEGL